MAVALTVGSADTARAQFQVPQAGQDGQAQELPQRLTYAYNIGTQSEILINTDRDLDRSNHDNTAILKPDIHGYLTYRPTDWLEGTAELILEREISLHREKSIVLPNGETQFATPQRTDLLVDQAFVTVSGVTDPFEFSLGRKAFSDERNTIYDTSIDVAQVALREGAFRAEALVGRERVMDWNLLQKEPVDTIDTVMLFAEYRGIEDIKLSAYAISRDDREGAEGEPLWFGVRSVGAPTAEFSYWADAAIMRGQDEESKPFRGWGVDAGATYRFLDLPLSPSVTLGYAFGSGDKDGDGVNNEFRQTGLQSNEARFAGVATFKTFGEALDPELSNLHILTAGLGFVPFTDVTVDIAYHHYRIDEFADELRNSGVTALINDNATSPSKDIGDAIDIAVGWRNMFGVRGLGADIRGGWLFPGEGFRQSGANDIGFAFATKFQY